MGIHDREYYQTTGHGPNPLARITSTAVGTIILVNVVIWLIQAVTRPLGSPRGAVTDFLGASPAQVISGLQVWRLFTANFAHDPTSVMHVFWNMLFLFFFGRDIESIYGRRDFYLLYLGSGVIAVLAEVVMLAVTGHYQVPVLGASGAVMAVLMMFTLHFPTRTILLFLVIPVPVWVLCVLFIVGDLSGAFAPSESNHVANFAHLAGFLMGFLFRYYDLRCARIAGWWRRLFGRRALGGRRARGREGKVIPFPRDERRDEVSSEVAAISERIDALLEKISTSGKESLTAEELEFLKENSGKYRSPKA